MLKFNVGTQEEMNTKENEFIQGDFTPIVERGGIKKIRFGELTTCNLIGI